MLLELIVFGAIAAILVFWLRSLLGQHNPGDSFGGSADENYAKQMTEPQAAEPVQTVQPPRYVAEGGPVSVSEGLKSIQYFDNSFNEQHFLSGACSAFEMVVKAYDAGDRETLKSLLSPDCYAPFEQAIDHREKRNFTQITNITEFEDADIKSAQIIDERAEIIVSFVTQQSSVTKDPSGVIVQGEEEPDEVIDLWTFSRPLASKSPKWEITKVDAG